MDSPNRKIFIISLDGATFSVINPLIRQGYMPVLGKLMSRSVAAELESVVPPVTAPAWTSFMTGKLPNKHGIFDFSSFNPAHYNWTINNAGNIQSKTLWQILSEHNKRVVVLNLPYTYPPYPVNGVLVSGWDAPFTGAFSYPATIGSDILSRFPDYKDNLWISELQPLRSEAHFVELVRKLKTGFEQQTAITQDLLEKQSWDVFMVHFQQTDWIQHKLWTYIEQGCTHSDDHDSKIEKTRNCYRRFDELIGKLLEQVEPLQPVTILLSDHGFGRLMGSVNANYYLKQWGYLSVASEPRDKLKSAKNYFRESNNKAVRQAYNSIGAARNALRSLWLSESHDSWADNASDVLSTRGATWDWNATKAAVVYAYQMGFVYINVVGRGPRGIVVPGRDYEMIVNDLISRFREVRHGHTGETLIQDVVRGVDVYPAADNDVMVPDLVLIPVEGYGFSFSLADAVPQVTDEGTHRHNGVLMIGGDVITHPTSDFRPHLIDVAPTILHLMRLPVPRDMDGRVWEELLLLNSPVRHEEIDGSFVPVAQNYSQADSEIIEQRLKGLGYLD